MSISCVILAKDEEENLGECLSQLKFCDEIIVLDDDSKDETAKIARKFGARVYSSPSNSDFSKKRNFGLGKARNEWVLFIDADERLTPELCNEIKSVVEKASDINGYCIKRSDFLWGRKLSYGESGCTKLLRLGKRGKGGWVRGVHEMWEIEGRVGELRRELYHYPHKNVSDFIQQIDKWSSLHARQNLKDGKKSNIVKIIVFPLGKFILNFCFRLGFLDGVPGMVAALMMSLHSFLAWSKLWLLQRNQQKP